MVSDPGPRVYLHLFVDNQTGTKVIYPGLVSSSSKSMLVVPPVGSRVSFVLPTYGLFHTIPWNQIRKALCHEAEHDSEF